jgi:hypothetical protein
VACSQGSAPCSAVSAPWRCGRESGGWLPARQTFAARRRSCGGPALVVFVSNRKWRTCLQWITVTPAESGGPELAPLLSPGAGSGLNRG